MSAIGSFLGPPLATFVTGFFVDLCGKRSDFTVPIICLFKAVICIPMMYMIFGQFGNFELAIFGMFGDFFLCAGWDSCIMHFLLSVLEPHIRYLGINMIIILNILDNMISPIIAGSIDLALGITEVHAKGLVYFWMMFVPLIICVPFFFLAGVFISKRHKSLNLDEEERFLEHKKRSHLIKSVYSDSSIVNAPAYAQMDRLFHERVFSKSVKQKHRSVFKQNIYTAMTHISESEEKLVLSHDFG